MLRGAALLLGLIAFPVGTLHAETPGRLVAQLQPFVEKHELAGAVAVVADREKILSVDAVGFQDVRAGKTLQPDALFWIASQSKAMTAVALLMLVDEGKVALDDPVEKHLPEFKSQMVRVGEKLDQMPGHPITVREVLSHMSGLPFKSDIEGPALDGLPLETAVASYAMGRLKWEPGTQYEYSNAGINTAARIIEVVAKVKYEDFMQERLFTPLGMKDTTFWPTEAQVERLAKSYSPDAGDKDLKEVPLGQLTLPLTDRTRRFPMPAGGLFSTARDVAVFCQMLLRGGEWNGRLYLSEGSFKELTRRQTPETVKQSYGLGLVVGADWFGHGGAHATLMEIHPREDYVLVWMVQHAKFPGEGGKAVDVFKRWAAETAKGKR